MSNGHSVEEIAAEFRERKQAGEDLKTEDFLAEHPEHADELRGLLDLMLDMEKIRPIARMGYSDYTVVEKVVTIPHILHPLEAPIDPAILHSGFEGQPGVFKK